MRNTFKAGIAAGAALALVAMGSPLAASADDTAPPEAAPVAIVEAAPVELVAEAVTIAEPPALVIEAAPEATPEPVETEAAAPAQAERTVAPMTVQQTKTVSWLTPYTGATAPSASDPAIWPQTLYTAPECGTGWLQVDVYKYGTDTQRAIVDALIAKGTLDKVNGTPEDSAVYISHQFVQQEACPPPVVVPNSLELSHTVECGVVTITLRNVSPWIYPTSVEIDGVHSYGPTVDNRSDSNGDGKVDLSGPQKDASKTRTITFAEDSGTHTVRYRIDAGSERDLYVGTPLNDWIELTVESDCQPPVIVVPEQPADVVTVTETEATDCETDTVTTTTVTTTTGTEYDEASNTWVALEPVSVTTTSEREATVEECPAVIVPPVAEPTDEDDAPVTPTADRLAYTFDESTLATAQAAGGIGGLSVLAGLIAMTVAKLRGRNAESITE